VTPAVRDRRILSATAFLRAISYDPLLRRAFPEVRPPEERDEREHA
jgi:hypothetical protein